MLKKLHILLTIIFAVGTITFGVLYLNCRNELKYIEAVGNVEYSFPNSTAIDKKIKKKITSSILKQGCIQDEEDALKIGEAIIRSVYKYSDDDILKLTAEFDSENDVWLINPNLRNTTDPEKNEYAKGGGPHLVLNAKNAQVVSTWADK